MKYSKPKYDLEKNHNWFSLINETNDIDKTDGSKRLIREALKLDKIFPSIIEETK